MAESAPRSRITQVVEAVGEVVRELPVRMSYQMIRLFSEGLYQSPHKAVEELVANGYDAGASSCWILTPRDGYPEDALWVIDDGSGMDEAGFQTLWQIAKSPKADSTVTPVADRVAIGQFGIGKLAAYVLGERLTHISCQEARFLLASMDFTRATGNQWEDQAPIELDLREVSEAEARDILSEVEDRDPAAWSRMFGASAGDSWTAAAISEFKPLMDELKVGILGWVLRTGLPIVSNFRMILNGVELEPPERRQGPLLELVIGGDPDPDAESLGLKSDQSGVEIPGIGKVTGRGAGYEQELEGGKSDRYGRSYGLFLLVRKRVINLEDDLFGLPAQNFAAWSRFYLRVEADGLSDYLQSSREGVRDVSAVADLREFLKAKFLRWRRHYERFLDSQLQADDIQRLLSDAMPALVREPILRAIDEEVRTGERSLYYTSPPTSVTPETAEEWLRDFRREAEDSGLFLDIQREDGGRYGPPLRFDLDSRIIFVNQQHPFVAHMMARSRGDTVWKLFAASEVLTDVLAAQSGGSGSTDLLRSRDRILRFLVRDAKPVSIDAEGLLDAGTKNPTAMERAVGNVFEVLGLRYRGLGGKGKPDGLLTAELGVTSGSASQTFRVVFDAKTSSSTVAAAKARFSAIHRFQQDYEAAFGFVIADKLQGEASPESDLNREAVNEHVTVLTVDQLKRLVRLHTRFGVTLGDVRTLFEGPYEGGAKDRAKDVPQGHYSVPEVDVWLDALEKRLSSSAERVPIAKLLDALEELKTDEFAAPNIAAVRTRDEFKRFPPGKLLAVLSGVEAAIGDRALQVVDERVFLNAPPQEILRLLDEAVDGHN